MPCQIPTTRALGHLSSSLISSLKFAEIDQYSNFDRLLPFTQTLDQQVFSTSVCLTATVSIIVLQIMLDALDSLDTFLSFFEISAQLEIR